MKNIIKIILALLLIMNISFGKELKYEVNIKNINFVSENAVEFEIYILNKSTEKSNQPQYCTGQYFINLNTGNSGTDNLKYTILNSELPAELIPRNPSVDGNILRLAANSIPDRKYILPEITSKTPGLLIAKMRLESANTNFSKDDFNLGWILTDGRFRTKIFFRSDNLISDLTEDITFSTGEHIENLNNVNSSMVITNYTLFQNFPNPFNPVTKIRFEIPNAGQTEIKIYDMLGKEVQTLLSKNLETGRYEVAFDGSNTASGIYFYKIVSGNFSQIRKMVLIR